MKMTIRVLFVVLLLAGGLIGLMSTVPAAIAQVTPGTPQLQATAGDGYVLLNWSEPTSFLPITEYRIYRGETPGGEGSEQIATSKSPGYHDTQVSGGQTYYYRVSAVSSAGEGSKSEEKSASPVGPPSAPQNLKATAGDRYVNLSWSAPSDDGGSSVTQYLIYRGTAPGEEQLLPTVITTLSYHDTFVEYNQTYYYKVSAKNAVGEGVQSNEVRATPTESTTPQDESSKWFVPVLIILAVIAIATAAIVIYLQKWKKISIFGALTPVGAKLCPRCDWKLALIIIALAIVAIDAILLMVLGLIAWWWLVVLLVIALIVVIYILWMRRTKVEEKKEEEKKRFCMHCGSSMPLDVKECPKCEKEIPPGGGEVKVCKNCDTAIPMIAKFCSECGASQPPD